MSSNSPCAACKLLRRKCTPECIFAPYFPPDQPSKFGNVHRVFGASNVAKLLKQIAPEQREDAVVSLSYEAEARLRDPVHGCVGYIYLLQHKLQEVQHDLADAKKELAAYIGPSSFGHFLPQPQHMGTGSGTGLAAPSSALPWVPTAISQEQQQRQNDPLQYHSVAVLPMAAREQEMLSNYSLQQQGYDRPLASLPAQLFNSSTAPYVIEHYFEQAQAKARSEGRSGGGGAGGTSHSSWCKQNKK